VHKPQPCSETGAAIDWRHMVLPYKVATVFWLVLIHFPAFEFAEIPADALLCPVNTSEKPLSACSGQSRIKRTTAAHFRD
jgi:hypothetical protein